MEINWSVFTPWEALAGGVVLGVSAAVLLLFAGRVAGISGIVAGLLWRSGVGEYAWRLAFVIGLVGAPFVYGLFAVIPDAQIGTSTGLTIAAGLLVGFGTRLANGCTSGHGVCGIARLSLRSVVATVMFMATGFLTVYLMRHVW